MRESLLLSVRMSVLVAVTYMFTAQSVSYSLL